MRLEDRIEQIRQDIASERYTTAAKESAEIIEFAHREIFRRSFSAISGLARRRVIEIEQQIGGANKSVEQFTLGELVGLFREAKLFAAYSEATGVQLRAITMVDFKQVVALRNRMQHDSAEASRGEAQLFLHCVENMLEAFGILSLDAAAEAGQRTEGAPRVIKHAVNRPSSYSPQAPGEDRRLDDQALLTRSLDREMFSAALDGLTGGAMGLDVGCARGDVTIDRFGAFESSFAAIVGIDGNAACIAAAGERHQGKYAFAQIDVEAVDAGDRLQALLDAHGVQRDVPIVAALLVVLHHLAAPIRVLKTLRSVLPRGSRVIIRTIDEGSYVAYPDPSERVRRLVALGAEYADGTDRFQGRKLQHQLYRAGFRDVQFFVRPYNLASLADEDRQRLFRVEFGFRQNLCRRALGDSANSAAGQAILASIADDISEIELDFDDPAYSYSMCWYGAVARL